MEECEVDDCDVAIVNWELPLMMWQYRSHKFDTLHPEGGGGSLRANRRANRFEEMMWGSNGLVGSCIEAISDLETPILKLSSRSSHLGCLIVELTSKLAEWNSHLEIFSLKLASREFRSETLILKLPYWNLFWNSRLETLVLKLLTLNSHLEGPIFKLSSWNFHLDALTLKLSYWNSHLESPILKLLS